MDRSSGRFIGDTMEVKIGSKNYECSKYGTSELADLQDWLKERQEDKIIARAHKVYGDNLPDRIYDDLSKEITLDDLGDAITTDLKSINYLIFLTVKKTNVGITIADVNNGIGGVDEAVKMLASLSPSGKTKKKPPSRKK